MACLNLGVCTLSLASWPACAVVAETPDAAAAAAADGNIYTIVGTDKDEVSSGGNQVNLGGITNLSLGFDPVAGKTAVYVAALDLTSSATVTGGAGGQSSAASVAFFDIYGAPPVSAQQSGVPQLAYVVLSDNPNFCAEISKRSAFLHDSAMVTMLLYAHDAAGNSGSIATGAYDVDTTTPGQSLQASFCKLDSQCTNLVAADNNRAVSGSVMLDTFTVGQGATLSGSFSLGIGRAAEPITGTFRAAPCPGMIATLGDARHVIKCSL